MPPSPSTPPEPRLRRRDRWIVAGLVAAAALGVLLLWLSDALRPEVPAGTGEEPVASGEAPDASLVAQGRARKPLPPDTVEVVVVARDGGEPVSGVGVRLRPRLLATDDEDGPRARTNAAGRARLRGEFPAFVALDTGSWTADPAVVAAEGGGEVRFEVVPPPTWRASLLDATTGLPLGGWQLCPAGLPDGLAPTWTDTQGSVAWPGLASPPTLVAASDGRRRVHSFLLYAVPGRTDVRLAVPAVARATRLRVLDPERHPIPGARAHVLAEATGVAVDLDGAGEADLEYGARDEVVLVVTAPGFVRRRVVLDGRPEETVVLERAVTRRFVVRTQEGLEAPDGTRLRGYAPGPASYGARGLGLEFAGTVAGGTVEVADLPTGAFEGVAQVRGDGLYALVRFEAPADPAEPVPVRSGPPRPFALRFVRPRESGEAEAWAGLAWVHAPASTGCRLAGADLRAALDAAVRAGRADEAFATLSARLGPETVVEMPTCDEARAIQVATPGGDAGCVEIGPGDAPGAREVRLTRAVTTAPTSPTVLLVEWEDGVPAALVSLRAVSEDSGAPPEEVVTDSSGVAFLSATRGRFTFSTTRPDGTGYASDGLLLLPSPGIPLVRLKPIRR